MAIALILLALVVGFILLLGAKMVAVFGIVVACATFKFPFGLIGLVGVAISLTFLLRPRTQTD